MGLHAMGLARWRRLSAEMGVSFFAVAGILMGHDWEL